MVDVTLTGMSPLSLDNEPTCATCINNATTAPAGERATPHERLIASSAALKFITADSNAGSAVGHRAQRRASAELL